MTALPPIDLTIYPYDCDAFGHLNHATALALFERARWDSLINGPGVDLFHRNGVIPVVRKADVEYHAAAFPGDRLRVELSVIQRGTTSWTMRHAAHRATDSALIVTADIVLVCVDRAGRPTPVPEEIARFLGPKTGTGHPPQRVVVDGATLIADVRGDGLPVLFIHGFPLDRSMWRHQVAALSRWKRIVPDLRGVGESQAANDEYSMGRYADDLVALLDALAVRRAVVCGLSMGGYILFELLRRHPERVRGAVLCDTRPDADSAEARARREELAELAQAEGPEAVGARMLPRLLAPATLAQHPEIATQCREMAARFSVAGMVGALRAMRDRPDSTPLLGKIAVPTLVVVGAVDQTTPPAVAQAMAEAIPGARLAVVPDAAHLSTLEQPLATSRAIADFLDSLA